MSLLFTSGIQSPGALASVLPRNSFRVSYDKPKQRIKKQRHLFSDTGPCTQSYDFSSGYSSIVIWSVVLISAYRM